jgi:mRNA interferase RelE/StbE
VYSIEFTKEAARFIERQDYKTANRILAKIDELAKDPYAPNNNVKKLAGRDGYSIGFVSAIFVSFTTFVTRCW